MQLFRIAVRRTTRLATAVATWCLMAPMLFADAPAPEAAAEKSYVLPYIFVVLLCALGLAIVGRSAHRTNELKYSEDDD